MTYQDLIAQLSQRKAIIVHCSPLGKALGDLLFPSDLKNAAQICAVESKELCCSVIWPSHVRTWGAVGIILRPRSTASIRSVSPIDAGSGYDRATGIRTGGGVPFTEEAVNDTFDNTADYNEWTVTDADTVGVFVNFNEPLAATTIVDATEIPGYRPEMSEVLCGPQAGERLITIEEIISEFAPLPVYTYRDGELVRLDAEVPSNASMLDLYPQTK